MALTWICSSAASRKPAWYSGWDSSFVSIAKIKDASDTNTDFDDLDGAIRSGYFLKEGLGNNEDFIT